MSDIEQELFGSLVRLIAAVAPFSAKHKQDKCYCKLCNELRRALLDGARTVEKYQPPTL